MPSPIAADLVGTWSYPDRSEPDGVGYCHFTRDRFFQVVTASRIPRGGTYLATGPSEIVITLGKAPAEKVVVGFVFDGASLVLSPGNCVHSRVAPEQVPAWFRRELEKYLSLS